MSSNTFLRIAPWIFVLLWSTGFTVSKIGVADADPFMLLALRFAIASILLLMLAMAMGRTLPKGKAFWSSALIGLLLHGLYLGGVFWAIDRGMPAGIASVIVAMHPVVTAVLAVLFLSETLTRNLAIGLFLGFIGVVAVIAPDFSQFSTGITTLTLLSALVATAGIAVGTVFQKQITAGTDLIAGTSVQFAAAAIFCSVAALSMGETDIQWTPNVLFALAWLTLVLSIGAILLLMFMIREGAVGKVATYFYLVPAVTVLQSYFLFTETLSWTQIIGLAITMIAVAIANR